MVRTPARRPGDKLRQPNQVAVVAPAEKEPAVAEEKEVEHAVAEQKEVAARADGPAAKVAERPRVEAPGKADTVKMGIKVVGGDIPCKSNGVRMKPWIGRLEAMRP